MDVWFAGVPFTEVEYAYPCTRCRRLQACPQGYVPRPDLILLDLNMPKKDGRSVLAEVKADPRLKTIPLIVLTSSQAEFDIQQSYKLLASCYVVKPLNVMELVKSLNEFWLSRVKFRKRVTDTTPT
jgi:CheY-like chemotaxis protein